MFASMRTNGPLIVRSSVSRPKPLARARRPTATRTLSAAIARSLPSANATLSAPIGEPSALRADQRFDAKIGEAPHDRLRQLRVVKRQDLGQRLDDRHLRRRAWRTPCRAPSRYSLRRPPRAIAGTSVSASASVDDRTSPPNLSAGSSTGSEPVARTRCSHWMRLSPVSALTVAVLPSTIVAIPRSVRTLAFFKSAPTPFMSRVTIASFQAMVRAKSSFGGPIESPMAPKPRGSRRACGDAGGMDQRLRGNAADVEAGSAEPISFDENRVEAELAGADRGDIAAWTAADDENLAAKLVHVGPPSQLFVTASGCEAVQSRSARRSPAIASPERCWIRRSQ